MTAARRPGPIAVLIAILLVAPGCARSAGAGADRELVVLAAASLTEAFTEIAGDFERVHPGVRVRLSFGPSDGLAIQIVEGAPADVFAPASPRWMDEVERRGPGVSDRAPFARNVLVVITPSDDPGAVRSFADLARPGLRLVLAAPGVPAGDYAREALRSAGILQPTLANLASNEEDVKAVVQKVVLGEADAGIVYRTDVTPAIRDEVRVVHLPRSVDVTAVYPIAVVASTGTPRLARAFVRAVLGPGQAVLRAHGFLPPP